MGTNSAGKLFGYPENLIGLMTINSRRARLINCHLYETLT